MQGPAACSWLVLAGRGACVAQPRGYRQWLFLQEEFSRAPVGRENLGRVHEVQLPEYLEDAIEVLSYQAHECWSVSKISDGFTYAATRGPKTHPALLPYFMLSPEDQVYDKDTSRSCIKCICAGGYDIVKNDSRKTAALEQISKLLEEETRTQTDLFRAVEKAPAVDDYTSMMDRIDLKTTLHLHTQDSSASGAGPLRKLFLDSNPQSTHENWQCVHHRTLHPDSSFLLYWNVMIMILVVMTCFETTYSLSFGVSEGHASHLPMVSSSSSLFHYVGSNPQSFCR